MPNATCPNCNEYFGVDRYKYIGDHIESCREKLFGHQFKQTIYEGEIYNSGLITLITFIAFLVLASIGTVGGGVLLIGSMLEEGFSGVQSFWTVVLFLVGLIFLAILKSYSMALKNGINQVSGEATFTISRGEASVNYYASVAGEEFGVADAVYNALEDGDDITVNYYANNWVKSVYLNRRAEPRIDDRRLEESVTSPSH